MSIEEPHSIDVASIEKELTVLWKEAEEGDGSSPVIRACSLNLLVLGEDDAETEGTLDTLSSEHPARTFLISASSNDSAPSVEAWVAAKCSIPLPGEKQVCCEQIHLRAKGNAGDKVTSVVTSLLVPDIPVVLWRRTSDSIPDRLFSDLEELCDFTILDSAKEGRLATSFELLEKDEPVVFGDLAWERIEPWRQLFAHIFDSPAAKTDLETLTGVRIVYAEQTGSPSSGLPSAMLFAGWLSHVLEWKPESVLSAEEQEDAAGEFMLMESPVKVVLVGDKSGDHVNGSIRSIVLEFKDAEYRFSVNAPSNCFRFVRKVRDGMTEDRSIPKRGLSDTEVLSRLLTELDSDLLYRASLLALTGKRGGS